MGSAPAGWDVILDNSAVKGLGGLGHESSQTLPGHDESLIGQQREGQPNGIARGVELPDQVWLARQPFSRLQCSAVDLIAQSVSDLLVLGRGHPRPPSPSRDCHQRDRYFLPLRIV